MTVRRMVSNILKYGIEVHQKLHNGTLGGLHQSSFEVTLDSVLFEISIEQCGTRKIIITTDSNVELDELIKVFNELDMLIMLGEGQFIPVVASKIITNGVVCESNELNTKFTGRLRMFDSADFTIGNHSSFITFDKYIDEQLFMRWTTMLKELDILHHMVLYSLADTGLTVDCKNAFLIEAFEALSELIEKYDTSYKRPTTAHRGESKLNKCLSSVIEKYGVDIFSKEKSVDIEKVVQIFVNSRNRIAHIKSNQNKKYLTGPESVLYAVKMSFLYRSILLILLGVNYGLYSSSIIKSIESWDKWNNISDDFLKKIQQLSTPFCQ